MTYDHWKTTEPDQMTTHFDYERYSVAQAAHPCLDWYVIDNDTDEIVSTHALAAAADAEAMSLNDN